MRTFDKIKQYFRRTKKTNSTTNCCTTPEALLYTTWPAPWSSAMVWARWTISKVRQRIRFRPLMQVNSFYDYEFEIQ